MELLPKCRLIAMLINSLLGFEMSLMLSLAGEIHFINMLRLLSGCFSSRLSVKLYLCIALMENLPAFM